MNLSKVVLWLVFLFGFGIVSCVAKKSNKDWNSFSQTKKLSEMERTETERLNELGDSLPQIEMAMIFVYLNPHLSQSQNVNLALKWRNQLKSGGITTSFFPIQGEESQWGIQMEVPNAQDILEYLLTQDEVVRCRFKGNEYR